MKSSIYPGYLVGAAGACEINQQGEMGALRGSLNPGTGTGVGIVRIDREKIPTYGGTRLPKADRPGFGGFTVCEGAIRISVAMICEAKIPDTRKVNGWGRLCRGEGGS